MFTNPYLSCQIASDRYREMLASAEQQRQARQLLTQTRASRPAGRTARRLRRLLHIASAAEIINA